MTESQALQMIQSCLASDRYGRTYHFDKRMDERGLTWPDIMGVVEQPDQVAMDGYDDYGRERCLIGGRTSDQLAVKIVCVINESGRKVVLITVHYED